VASLVGEEMIAPPDRVVSPPADNWIGVGSAWEAFPVLTANLPKVQPAARSVLPRARDLLPTAARQLARGETVSADQALPVYLREKVAWQGGPSKN
jgi:tRNA threonylcarbamoyladenosine biosynthesis protein TsaB